MNGVIMLADTAVVRSSLLSIISAGISRLERTVFPAPLGASLVFVGQLTQEEAQAFIIKPPHLIFDIRLHDESPDADPVVHIDGLMTMEAAEVADITNNVHAVLNLEEAALPSPGRYEITANWGGHAVASYTFRAEIMEHLEA